VRWGGVSREFDCRLSLCRNVHRISAFAARRGNECARCRLQLCFGIDQEVRRSHNLIARTHSLREDLLLAHARTEFNFPRLNISIAAIREHQVPCSRMEDSRARNYQLPAEREFEPNVDIHARPQLQARVRDHQPDRQSTGSSVYLRKQIIDTPGKHFSRIRIDGDLCMVSRLNFARVALESFRA